MCHSPNVYWIPPLWKATNGGEFQFLFYLKKKSLFTSLFISWLNGITWGSMWPILDPKYCFLKWNYSWQEIPSSSDSTQWFYRWDNWGSEGGSGLQLGVLIWTTELRKWCECLFSHFSQAWYITCTITDGQDRNLFITYKGHFWTLGLNFLPKPVEKGSANE